MSRRDDKPFELFDIQPIILGGDPVDPKNKVKLSREEHMKLVRYWNKFIADLQSQVTSAKK